MVLATENPFLSGHNGCETGCLLDDIAQKYSLQANSVSSAHLTDGKALLEKLEKQLATSISTTNSLLASLDVKASEFANFSGNNSNGKLCRFMYFIVFRIYFRIFQDLLC